MIRRNPHSDLVNEILLKINPFGRFWKNNTGTARSMDGERIVKYGLEGSADIIGLLRNGRFVAIEVKTGSAVQNKKQILFQKMIEKNNGIYFLARDSDSTLRFLESVA